MYLGGIYPPSDAVTQWCIDTRKGGKYEHLLCYTSASFPIKDTFTLAPTKPPQPPITESQTSAMLLLAEVITDSDNSKDTSTAVPKNKPGARPTAAHTSGPSTVHMINRKAPSSNESAPTTGTNGPAAAAVTMTRPFSPPATTTARISDFPMSLADAVKLRKRVCTKQRP